MSYMKRKQMILHAAPIKDIYGAPVKSKKFWQNVDDVCAYARSLGSGKIVYKDPHSPFYNIVDSIRNDRFKRSWIVLET